ncbi:hypothetical protein PWYN_20485 [Paenibacillus wynnii]|uniref:Uncharacterized protein n=1 Tax=Paenibacillus wynnii TaxID=268407 RepID=A0A098M4T1_9BACL|nr:hypothetical protein PWYN_20485 [Paenibacillus wynnii]
MIYSNTLRWIFPQLTAYEFLLFYEIPKKDVIPKDLHITSKGELMADKLVIRRTKFSCLLPLF